MGEQKNLFLAIGLSVAIIVIFQIHFPQQTAMTPPENNKVEQIQPTTSIDDTQAVTNNIIKTKKEVIDVDVVLVAVGVFGNISNLGLEKLGVKTDAGFILTNKHMQTNISNIYAREDFRKTSLISQNCSGIISGFGLKVYHLALQSII